MAKELEYLGRAMTNPKRPFVAILGGAKVSDKIGVLRSLVSKVDALLVGGGMAYTFLKAQGMEIGVSLLETDKLDVAREVLVAARAKGVTFVLPMDHIIAQKVAPDAETRTVDSTAFPAGWIPGPSAPGVCHAIREPGRWWNGPGNEMAPRDIAGASRGK
jgi:phosphoglycerate kinase